MSVLRSRFKVPHILMLLAGVIIVSSIFTVDVAQGLAELPWHRMIIRLERAATGS